ncbi:hypothetical protein Mapa_010328 [Marchantia paleacea]|nr:hypothetical protein Mapa_010328 [Marchantia paleacea]
MAEFVIKRIRMPRQHFSGYFTCVCVVLVFLMHLASAERLKSSRGDAGADSLDLLLGAGNQYGMIPKSVSDAYGSGDKAASSASSSSMAPIDRHSPWYKGLENLSHRIFQLGAEKEAQWPELKLTQLRTILGIVFGGIGAGLSSAGGLGGGGLFVPLFNLMLQFDPKTSAALSNFMILGGSIVNLIINLRQHHPIHKNKPVIDFDVLLLMQPNMLLGISIGVIFNVVLPSWLITALLALVLGYMTFHSIKGGLKRWSRESQQNQARREALEAQARAPVSVSTSTPADENQVTAAATAPKFSFPTSQPAANGVKDSGASSLTTPLLSSAPAAAAPRAPKLIPRRKIAALVVVWFAFFSVQVLRGGKSDSSVLGFEKCGIGYWALTSTQIPLALILTAWTINQLRQYHGAPNKDNAKVYDIQEEGYVLGPESATLFPWMALVAGVLGGMLGIGGGMIINPLLFTVGMLPQVTAATCASMVFFSSSMSVIQYWLMGRIPLQYALISAFLCAIFSWFGIVIVHKAIEKYNRASLIVFSVAAVMGVSAVLMCGFGGYDVWRQYEGGGYMGFHYPC